MALRQRSTALIVINQILFFNQCHTCFESLGISFFSSFRNAVQHSLEDCFFGNAFGQCNYCAQSNNVRKQSLAANSVGSVGDRQVNALAVLAGNISYEKSIGNNGGMLIAVGDELVGSLLAHYQQSIRADNTAEINGLIADDSLGLGGAAAGFRAVGLGLYSQLVV